MWSILPLYLAALTIIFMMKNIFLLLLFFLTTTVFSRPCVIHYTDGTTENVEVSFPLTVGFKKFKVKVNGERKEIDPKLIEFLSVDLNDGADKAILMRGQAYNFKDDELNKSEKASTWLLVNGVTDSGYVISNIGLVYHIQKVRGVEKIVVTYLKGNMHFGVSKLGDDGYFKFLWTKKRRLKKQFAIVQPHLFPDCPNLPELIDNVDIKRDEDFVYSIIEQYEKCKNN